MTQPTVTRSDLRDQIALRMGMEFHKRYGGSGTIDSYVAGTPAIVDAALVQSADYWNQRWLMVLPAIAGSADPAGDIRRVTDFATPGSVTLDQALSASPTAGTLYQMFDVYSPYEIHAAINNANREGAKTFFGVQVDEDTLVVKTNTLEYAFTSLSPTPWKIYNIWVELPSSVIRGTATAGAATTLTDTAHNFVTDGAAATWKVSIYDGTGAGQVRTISSVSGSQLTIPTWTTNPDSTSKYCIWNPSEQYQDWKQILGVRFDRQEFPSKMYLHARYESYAGMRLRFQYSYKPSDMTDDDDTTPVLPEFIVPWAMKELYEMRTDSSRVDRPHYVSKTERLRVEAEQARASSEMHEPAMSLFMYDAPDGGYGGSLDDPMGWNG